MIYLNVKDILAKKNESKYWLVQQMESDFQSVTDMMNNKTISIRFETIEKLCRILECTPNDIFIFKDDVS